MLLTITEFLGHFHPLLVHLPIGILLIGLLLQLLARKERYRSLESAIPLVLLCGAISAFASCITGYLLSISDDYDKTLVSWHMWMGIATALVSLMLYAKQKNPLFAVSKPLLAIGLFVLLMITGHLGGSLTHGSDYLTKPLKTIFGDEDSTTTTIKPIANVQEAMAYSDVIKPILETKCYACHNANKQKGGLRMDDSVRLMKGGKDGVVIEPGNANASLLMKRLLLPIDNDDHMPPKEKSQPTDAQIALLHWWIDAGALLNKKVKDINQDEKIKPVLTALQNTKTKKKEISYFPEKPVEAADETVITQLRNENILVLPLAQGTNYLEVNFINDSTVDIKDIQLLTQLQKQLVSLKLSNSNANDETLQGLATCSNIQKLYVDGTAITDRGLESIAKFDSLRYLNLANTKISAKGLQQLKSLKNISAIYLYHTLITNNDWAVLKQTFPAANLDSGGYTVPTLPSDTTEVKAKKEY